MTIQLPIPLDKQGLSPEKLKVYLSRYLKSKDMGINYQAIQEHLGEFPISDKKIVIDHILPIAAFDLNDKRQVTMAFHPLNHRYLEEGKNLSKGKRMPLISEVDPSQMEAYKQAHFNLLNRELSNAC